MNRVERCVLTPHHCAVFPQLGQAQRKGYYDTGTDLAGPGIHINRVYVSVEAVEALARKEGWVPAVEHQDVIDERTEALAELDQARAELAEYDRRFAAIDVLESEGFRSRKKPGRPRQELGA